MAHSSAAGRNARGAALRRHFTTIAGGPTSAARAKLTTG